MNAGHPAVVFVPTRGPSPLLERLLRRLAGEVCVLVDDPAPEAAAAVRTLAPQAVVIGGAERRAYVDALGEASGAPEAAEAALVAPPGPWRVGALRNLVLLRGTGHLAVSIDDDVVPEGLWSDGPPSRPGGLDPTTWTFFADREASWAGAVPVDPVRAHGRLLGRPRIAVTTTGLAGDHGGSRASAVLALQGATLAAFLADYEGHLASRAVRRVAPGPTVTDAPFLMAPCLGFDGRVVLPPFFPGHRNSDGVWGTLLVRHARSGFIGHVPLAIRHDPSPRRYVRADLARDAVRFRWSDLLITWARNRAPEGATPEARLETFGRHLAALADAPDLPATVREVARAWIAGCLLLAERAAAVPGPAAWNEDIAATRAALSQAAPDGPEEHLRDGRLDDAALRTDLRRFATILSVWPRLRAAAAILAS